MPARLALPNGDREVAVSSEPLAGCLVVVASEAPALDLILALEGHGATVEVAPGAADASEKASARGCDAIVFTATSDAEAWLASARETEQAGLHPLAGQHRTIESLVSALVACMGSAEWAIPTQAGVLVMRSTVAVLNGQALPLSPSGFALLRQLAAARGSVLSREKLAESLPGTGRGPHVVEAAINRLRDAANAKGLVKTVVKRGYALAVTGP